jgi:integrase
MSLHKQSGKWYVAFTDYDSDTGKSTRRFLSTKLNATEKNRKQAEKIAAEWMDAVRRKRKGELTPGAASEIIAHGLRQLFPRRHSNVEMLPKPTSLKAWTEEWLAAKSKETEPTTYDRYRRIIERFTEFVGKGKCNANIATLDESDVTAFRNNEAKERARGTANLSIKVLRVCFHDAMRKKRIVSNPASDVKLLVNDESNRRPFTVSEIKRILKACDDEWRGLVLFGLYIGQRLGDLARLTWRSVNLEQNEIAFTARKTGRRIVLPLVQPLVDYLSELPSGDNPNAFIFPNAAAHKRTASLSNQFREVLVEAGLAEAKDYRTTTKGRAHARESSELSFHSLRHSAVTLLKASGLSDVFAREIVGHESAAVSRQYTHLSTDDLRVAMQRLPDVTTDDAPAKARKKH